MEEANNIIQQILIYLHFYGSSNNVTVHYYTLHIWSLCYGTSRIVRYRFPQDTLRNTRMLFIFLGIKICTQMQRNLETRVIYLAFEFKLFVIILKKNFEISSTVLDKNVQIWTKKNLGSIY